MKLQTKRFMPMLDRTTKDNNDNKATRPVYLLRLRPVHGDGVHALRRLLKYSGRLGLRAISVSEDKPRQAPS
jgi:hypothetical protein